MGRTSASAAAEAQACPHRARYGTTGALGGRDKLKYLAGIGDRHRGERTGFVLGVDVIEGV